MAPLLGASTTTPTPKQPMLTRNSLKIPGSLSPPTTSNGYYDDDDELDTIDEEEESCQTDYELSYSHSDADENQCRVIKPDDGLAVEEESDGDEGRYQDAEGPESDDDGEEEGESQNHTNTNNVIPLIKPLDLDSSMPPRKRLTLLDLPVDILRLIVQEVSHINDLTCLARTNWTMHSLAIPVMYSRFDIVWPEAQGPIDEGKSVDALTFGLSTLCLGSSFAYRTRRVLGRYGGSATPSPHQDRLRATDYAKYTRKFALSNGPDDLVSEYVVDRESGKMLGTLVALALKRMINLESFVWDMPTGVLSEVFMALASLQDHSEDGSCNLKSVWVRWHCNSDNTPLDLGTGNLMGHMPPHSSSLTPVGHSAPLMPLDADEDTAAAIPSMPVAFSAAPVTASSNPFTSNRVEQPTFSVLSPLRSLTVLDIDDLAYLDEMAVLIAESLPILRDLRVSIADHVQNSPLFHPWDGIGLDQVGSLRWSGEPPASSRRLGGVMGVLAGHFFDIKKNASAATANSSSESAATTTTTSADSFSDPLHSSTKPPRKMTDGKLKLNTLALDRVSLSVYVCSRAIDWTVLTSITLLQCPYSWLLWRELHRQYGAIRPSTSPTARPGYRPSPPIYQLALKKIHTDLPCFSLIALVKDSLAPNSLETFFLHDRRQPDAAEVPIRAVFNGVIKPHRASLRRLSIGHAECLPGRKTSWTLPWEILLYMTSGRLEQLRELCIIIQHLHWHTLLHRLPNLPQLRSLYVASFTGVPHGRIIDTKELAMQIVDVVSIKPELPLCFVAFIDKCYEIMEDPEKETFANVGDSSVGVGGNNGGSVGAPSLLGNGGVVGNADATGPVPPEDETDIDPLPTNDEQEVVDPALASLLSDTLSEGASEFDGDERRRFAGPPRFRFREIMFYDDKVEMFKARHESL